jgi:HD-GYP domain-containing protein (c-di-GMP phosphodiesterase class II)
METSNPQTQFLLNENEKLRSILQISKIIGSEIHLDNLLQIIIRETSHVMEADRSSLFLVDAAKKELWSKVAEGMDPFTKVIRFPMSVGIAGAVATGGEAINIPDAYQDPRFNPEIDAKTGYRTRSILCMPIRNTKGKTIGVIQVLNKKSGPFTREDEDLLETLTSQAGISLENAALYKEIENLFEEVVSTIVTALDERDRTTAGHTKRVAIYTLKTAVAIHRSTAGVFADVQYSYDQLRRLRYASLLHDIGKIGVNENILNKATRLPDGHMLALLERLKRIRWYLGIAEKPRLSRDGETREEREEILKWVDEAALFLEDLNRPTRERLADEEKDRLDGIRAAHFIDPEGRAEPFLTDFEYKYFSIGRGNLTEEERSHIQSHVAKSFIILNQINWPETLEYLPLIAASHHECLDGTGYPHHLNRESIHFDAKIMAIADFYDALTAPDRPYKPQIPHDKAVAILQGEVSKGKIDEDIFKIFLEKEVYHLSHDDYQTFGMGRWSDDLKPDRILSV